MLNLPDNLIDPSDFVLADRARAAAGHEKAATADCRCEGWFRLMEFPFVGVCQGCGVPAIAVFRAEDQVVALTVVQAFQ